MDNIKIEFTEWLDSVLESELPEGIKAFNFNLYEGIDDDYHIELIASPTSPKDDIDWACYELFTTREDFFIISRQVAGLKWEEGLDFAIKLVEYYLECGKLADKLKRYEAVGVGFVDGDIEFVYEA